MRFFLNHQLIHQVLLREVKQPNVDEMWFNVNGGLVRFSIEEFCLIIGLQCFGEEKRSKYDEMYYMIKHEILRHLPTVLNSYVYDIFLHKSQLSHQDVVKFRILLLLTNLFFTTAYKRSMEESLMVIVYSKDMNSYAWDKELFKFTLSLLKSGLRNKTLIVEGDGRPYITYRLNGFLIAFQVWIYETLPVLDGKICTKISHRCLRILN
ncbi:DUF1985 domain-containing protein [Abeliophyllum distichum]|uniref:DUF1985 domain-containing protein n=1 Tax=Abeliophyllum distichum TaxID=126358 RepID=A0ABD1TKK9_9LAMI